MNNWERLKREAAVTDREHADYNSDMDIIVAGTSKTYRDMILAGYDPNVPDAVEKFQEANRPL